MNPPEFSPICNASLCAKKSARKPTAIFSSSASSIHPRAATAGRRRAAVRLQPLDGGHRPVHENIRLIAPDQTTVLSKGEMKFELRDPALHATNVMVFGQIEFKTAGTYFVEVLVDDVMKLRYPCRSFTRRRRSKTRRPSRRNRRKQTRPDPAGCVAGSAGSLPAKPKRLLRPLPCPALRRHVVNALTARPFSGNLRLNECAGQSNRGVGTFHPARRGGVCRGGARASVLVQFVAALLAAAAVVWFVDKGCFPVVGAAVQKLPATGEIRSGRLDWPGTRRNCWPEAVSWRWTWTWTIPARSARPPTCRSNLAGKPSGRFRCSVIGKWPYPRGYLIALNRKTLEPLWGAWAVALLFMPARRQRWFAVELVVAGDLLFSAGLAVGFFCEPRLEFPPRAGGWRARP
jgi:hypothetical protein